MTTQQTDADLIRHLEQFACMEEGNANFATGEALRRAAARLSELTQELETERMRLVACGVVAMANTRESAANARKMHPDYWCASVKDVATAVDREMALREKVEAMTQPAPLALSDEDAESWDSFVHSLRILERYSSDPQGRAILAVDALLRKRVQRLTDEQIDKILEQQRMRWATSPPTYEFAQAFARAVEAAHGIGEGA